MNRKRRRIFALTFALCPLALSSASAMEPRAFEKLLSQIDDDAFADGKMTTLSTAASTNTFSCAQAARILKSFSFDSGKHRALAALKSRLEDPRNRELLVAAFTFSSGQDKARKALADVRAAAPARRGRRAGYQSSFVWSERDFQAMLARVENASFDSGRRAVLRAEVRGRAAGLTAKQVWLLLDRFAFGSGMVAALKDVEEYILGMRSAELAGILEKISFDKDRLAALRVLAQTITDPENKARLLSVFTFDSAREPARKILEAVKGRSPLFGTLAGDGLIFVLDASGSMAASFKDGAGDRIDRWGFVLRELAQALKRLPPRARFNIVAFNDRVQPWRPALTAASPRAIDEALAFARAIKPERGTNLYGALRFAMDSPGCETIYALSDGLPTAGAKTEAEAILKELKKRRRGRQRIHSIAFLMGDDPSDDKPRSRALMQRLARENGGVFRSLE